MGNFLSNNDLIDKKHRQKYWVWGGVTYVGLGVRGAGGEIRGAGGGVSCKG